MIDGESIWKKERKGKREKDDSEGKSGKNDSGKGQNESGKIK
jgi:hypothetical protein